MYSAISPDASLLPLLRKDEKGVASAFGSSSIIASELSGGPGLSGLQSFVVDALGVQGTQEVVRLANEVLKPIAKAAPANSRVVLLTETGAADMAQAAAQHGLQSMARSLSKELGKKGTTLNTVELQTGSAKAMTLAQLQQSLASPVEFFLSPDSAFVTGQSLKVDMAFPGAEAAAAAASSSSPLRYAGKLAVVTGAAKGIGAAIAKRLASEGAHVIAIDIRANERHMEKTMASLAAVGVLRGSPAHLGLGAPAQLFVPCYMDVTDSTAAERLQVLVERVRTHAALCAAACRWPTEALPKPLAIDLLVHNAGLTADKQLRNMSGAAFQKVVDVNLHAVMRLNEALGLHGMEGSSSTGTVSKDARVVLLSSISGIGGTFGQTNYSFSKAALMSYAEQLGLQMRARGSQQTINAVAPGFIETDMTAKMPFMTREMASRMNAVGQGGRPADVAAAVAFLGSKQAAAVTGQTLRVCGGNIVGK